MIERVVIVSDDAVESGGAAGIALSSARLLSARGIPVTILNGSGHDDETGRRLGATVISHGGSHLLEGSRAAAAARGLYDRRAGRFVRDWIASNDTPRTVYHLHNWHKVLSPSVFAALAPVGERLVISAHDYFLVCPNGAQFHYPNGSTCELRPMGLPCLASSCDRRHYGHKLWRVARQAIRQNVMDLAVSSATVVAVHEGMITYLTRGGVNPCSIEVFRNPVTPWRPVRVVAERNRHVFFVGRLEHDKGADVAAATARKAGARLRIIGDGPLRDDLARAHPEAEFLGWRSRADLADLIASARLLVAPTRWGETFGLVILEALMSGVPVLVSQFALIAGEVAELGCAEPCNPYDVNHVARSMARLLEDDERVREMSERGFTLARRLAPTPDEWCDGLVDLYERKLCTSRIAPRNGDLSRRRSAAGQSHSADSGHALSRPPPILHQ